MSGGRAFVWRLEPAKLNRELVDLVAVGDEDEPALRNLLERHHALTASPVAGRLLARWPQSRGEFTAVVPRDYSRAVRVIQAAEAAGRDIDETVMAELSKPTPAPLTSPREAPREGPAGGATNDGPARDAPARAAPVPDQPEPEHVLAATATAAVHA
jgi:glutamate synthase (NADPH/NADH) large chain